MKLDVEGRTYGMYRQSDVDRDGISLELMDETDLPHQLVMDVFYSDVSQSFALTAFREAIPLELVDALISKARTSLPSAGT